MHVQLFVSVDGDGIGELNATEFVLVVRRENQGATPG
jgi:hypothetical protein